MKNVCLSSLFDGLLEKTDTVEFEQYLSRFMTAPGSTLQDKIDYVNSVGIKLSNRGMRQLTMYRDLTVGPMDSSAAYVDCQVNDDESSIPLGRYALAQPKPKRGLRVIVDAFSFICLLVAVLLVFDGTVAGHFTPAVLSWVALSVFGFLMVWFLKPR